MRDVAWDNYPNARDLGGLPTLHSPTGLTQFGRVVRGPRRELMSAEGLAAAKAWGLKSVVDIRNANEVGRRPADPQLDESSWEGISITLAPTEDQANPDFIEFCMPVLDSPEYWAHNVRILPDLIAGALRAIINAGPGVLVHCGAGRDRTGMISMMLLANAGVPPEAISADYAASVRAMAGTAHHGGPTVDRQSTWTEDETHAFLQEVLPIVEREVRQISATMESIGMTNEERQALKALLVASPQPS